MWRTFDVGTVVELLVADDARVVAGSSGARRTVRRAQVITSIASMRRARANDLVVITAKSLLATGETAEALIGRLVGARVAALAVRLQAEWPLPAALLAAADRLEFPIITFPDSAALTDVATSVLDALLDAQEQRLERFLEIHQRFTPIVLAGGGPTEIATTLREILQRPVVVIDAAGAPTVVVPSDAIVDIDIGAVPTARRPVVAGERNYGEVVVLIPDDLDQDGLLALERAATAMALLLSHASAVAAEQERFAAISLEELIAGHTKNLVDVTERASSFGWDLTRPRAVLLASVDPPAEHELLQGALSTIAAAARATLGPDSIVWARSTTIAALVAPGTDDATERRQLADGLRRALDERLQAVTVSIGVGRRVDRPADLPRSYIEASRAVDVGRWAKGRHVTEVFDQLGFERLLASTTPEDLAEFVENSIGRLIDHDRAHRTDLVHTLGTWFDTRNMAQAARQVHVHYNTFKNRLERIESILGRVLDEPAASLECEVAVYIFRHHEGPWSSTA